MRISDWSSDVCSSDLGGNVLAPERSQSGGNVVLVVVAGGDHDVYVEPAQCVQDQLDLVAGRDVESSLCDDDVGLRLRCPATDLRPSSLDVLALEVGGLVITQHLVPRGLKQDRKSTRLNPVTIAH